MKPIIRAARPEDLDDIVGFTTGTFEWGDYVPGAFLGWLDEVNSQAMVAEVDGRIRALARVKIVSPNEAWAGGMRVDPEFRRLGLGAAVSRELWKWATDQGAQVIRLLTESWNESAASMVASMGFRPTAQWVRAERGIGENSPVPDGNGGLRVKPPESLRPASS
ncbi:GNAT family N-acetyltransferase, partial [bacterium]|nr:GNAT family N-acetyltransferase [bacterium]